MQRFHVMLIADNGRCADVEVVAYDAPEAACLAGQTVWREDPKLGRVTRLLVRPKLTNGQ
jgi:hypothetical protein